MGDCQNVREATELNDCTQSAQNSIPLNPAFSVNGRVSGCQGFNRPE